VVAALVAYQWLQQRERGLSELQHEARVVRLALDRELTLDIAVLNSLAAMRDLDLGDWATVHSVATRAASVRPGSWIIGMDAAGQNTFNTAVPFGAKLPNFRQSLAKPGSVEWNGRRLPLPALQIFDDPLRTGQPSFSGLVYGRSSNRPVVATNVPVMRSDRATHVLGLAYSPDAYVELLRAHLSGKEHLAAIVDNRGLVVARNRAPAESVGLRAPAPLDQGAGALADDGVGETVSLDGEPVYYAFSRSRVNGWAVSVAIPKVQLLAPARQALLASLAFVLVMALIAGAFSRRLSQRIAVPLTTLAARAHAETSSFADVPSSGIEEVEVLKRAMVDAAAAQEQRRRSEAQREQAQRELELANAKLLEADRRKDEFLAMLGHELRNPLAALRTAGQVLTRTREQDHLKARMHDMVARQTTHLSRIVDDLLDVARVTHGKIMLHKVPLRLDELARSLAQDGRAQFEAKEIHFELHALRPVTVFADETRIAQVLANLLDNAIKYTPAGGRIALEVDVDGAEGVARMRDTGIGVPADLLPRLFQPFTQDQQAIERSEGGLGLGLAIVKRIMDLHGGHIRMRSEGRARGTEVEIRLPLHPGGA
jgi:signal transduction histidine kinase